MSLSRRRFVEAGALAGLAAGMTWSGRGRAAGGSRRIVFTNLHTGDRAEMEYTRGGLRSPAALNAIELVLRDVRSGERHAVDPSLMDYLADVAVRAGGEPHFDVISAYRAPGGVAPGSLHMQGRAIDVRMRGVDSADLAGHAVDLQRGGVGYYRAADFVHLDTGAFRTWRG